MPFRRQRGAVRPWFAGLILTGAAVGALFAAPGQFAKMPGFDGRTVAFTDSVISAPVAASEPQGLGHAAIEAARLAEFSEYNTNAAHPPAKGVAAISFGPALSLADAEARSGDLIREHGALAELSFGIVDKPVWSVWPAVEIVATGADEEALSRICDSLVLEGTSCGVTRVSPQDLAGLDPAPPAEAEEAVQTAALDAPTEEMPASAEAASLSASPRAHVYHLGSGNAFEDLREARIVAVGDVMMGSNHQGTYGLHPRLRRESAAIDDVLEPGLVDLIKSADIGFLNLEGVLLDEGDAAKSCESCFVFRSPEFYARLLAEAGFTTASLANNHSGDFGKAGRDATVSALRRNGIEPAGLPREDARIASQVTEDGLKIATAAFAPNHGTVSLHNIEAAEAIVRELDETHDIIIVSIHAGAEGPRASRVTRGTEMYLGEDRGNIHAFSHAMVKAGADLVIGHGPHVPRAVEVVDDRLIIYSLGNFWTYTGFISWGLLGVGPLADVTLAADGSIKNLTIHSTRQAGRGVPQLDPLNEARRFTLDRTRRDFPQTYALLRKGRSPLVASLEPSTAFMGMPVQDPSLVLLGISWPDATTQDAARPVF